jgi:hypothetical protein
MFPILRRTGSGIFAEMAELADARDLKSLGPKARPGSIPGLGTMFSMFLECEAFKTPKRRGVEQPGSSLGS